MAERSESLDELVAVEAAGVHYEGAAGWLDGDVARRLQALHAAPPPSLVHRVSCSQINYRS
jgi:hypothetical protein